MIIIVYYLVVVAAFHFIWEGIMLPSIRLRLRYKLFAVRDRLRWLKSEQRDDCPEEVFQYLQSAINTGLNLIHRTDLSLLLSARQTFDRDQKLRDRIEKREQMLADCVCDEVREIDRDIAAIARDAFLANSGAWFIYLVPIAIVALSFAALTDTIKKILATPEGEIEKFAPAFAY